MPYLDTAQAWLIQSSLLLQARPMTTRITTKYTLKPPQPASNAKVRKSKSTHTSQTVITSEPPAAPAPPTTRATLTLKTYDPVSGTTLKYTTDKAAEVGRLVVSLARLGRGMAALPEQKEDVMEGVESAAIGSGVATPVPESVGSKLGGQAVGGAGQTNKKKTKKKVKK